MSTPVVMPQMGGVALAVELIARRPGIKVLFMSGYDNGSALEENQLVPNSGFLQKPFSPTILVRKVREVLDGNVITAK